MLWTYYKWFFIHSTTNSCCVRTHSWRVVVRWNSRIWEPCSRHLWLCSCIDWNYSAPVVDEEICWTVDLLCIPLHADDRGAGYWNCLAHIFLHPNCPGIYSDTLVKKCLIDAVRPVKKTCSGQLLAEYVGRPRNVTLITPRPSLTLSC